MEFLKKLCRYHLSYTDSNRLAASMFYTTKNNKVDKISANVKFITDMVMEPVDYTFHTRVTNPAELTVELFDYQKCNVHWMLQKEKNHTRIYYNMNEEVILGNVFYDMYNQSFNMLNDRKSLEFTGGALIDEVGLGKTIQVLTLSMLNPSVSTEYVKKTDPSHLYSRGTLILCPNQLCGQWEREIQDKISSDYDAQIIKIMTKTHFDKYTYQDLLDADFVIVSYTFLDNKAFTLPWSQKVSTIKSFSHGEWNTGDVQSIKKTFEDMGKELVKQPFETLVKTNAFYQLIHWHRLVVDEFHEVYSDSRYRYIQNLLPFIRADHKWCVTATPFVKPDSLYHAMNFLTNYENKDGESILTNSKFVDYLSTECFRRNTKHSVKNEHTFPPIEEEIRWLKFTATERMMYNAYLANPNNDKFSVYLRQLCCHPQLADETKLALSNCKTLQEIETMMLTHYKSDMDVSTEKVKKVQKRITKVNKKIKKLEKKQKKKQLKKMGVDVSDSESSESSDDDSDEEIKPEKQTKAPTPTQAPVKKSLMKMIDDEEDDIKDINLGSGMDIDELELFKNMKSATMDNLKETLAKLEERLKLANKELEGKTTTFNFFNNVIERLRKTASKETDISTKIDNANKSVADMFNDLDSSDDSEHDDETCGICLDEIPEDDVGVTKCGHIFCYECLKMVVGKYHNCPYCKGQLNDNDIFILSFERKKKKVEQSAEDKKKEELINEVGTKLANLISFIKENDKHIIIFSQWDDLLIKVGRILAENGIKNVFCKGNSYQRDKAIREFDKDDSIKVIMLSSGRSASGTNLTKATQVILLDPMYGNYEYRKGQERQAIGRAHRIGQKNKIKVIRFIIKNSVEEEIYILNAAEDMKHVDSKDASKIDEITIDA